jgi:glycosyltransferase involved in cell wall biosynthesis
MKLSVIIPIYNEEGNIEPLSKELIFELDRLNLDYEIIFVNDGSTDKSPSILNKVSQRYPVIETIHLDKNYGQTTALVAGLKAAEGEIIVTMDGDIQNDPRDIPKLLQKLGEFDLVCGWRYRRYDPLRIKFASKIAYFIRNILTHDNIKDIGCGFKAYKRDCIDKLKLFERLHRFIPVLAMMEGFKVTEVQINHRPRKYGKSKYRILRQALTGLIDLLAVVWMQKQYIKYRINK